MIKWNDEKAARVLAERGIDFAAIADEIEGGNFAVRPV